MDSEQKGKCLNRPEKGCRVWAEWGLREHGRDKVSVPPKTVGTIVSVWNEFNTMDNPLHQVKWETGQVSIHYWDSLFCLGASKTASEFVNTLATEAVKSESVGSRHRWYKVFLKSGDWIEVTPGVFGWLTQNGLPAI